MKQTDTTMNTDLELADSEKTRSSHDGGAKDTNNDEAQIGFEDDYGQQQERPRRLSNKSKHFDLTGRGELDTVEFTMREMDVEGAGHVSNEQVYRIMREHMHTNKKLFDMKRIVLILLSLVILLAVSNLGTAWAAVQLAKETTVDTSDGNTLKVKNGGSSDQTVAVVSAGKVYRFPEPPITLERKRRRAAAGCTDSNDSSCVVFTLLEQFKMTYDMAQSINDRIQNRYTVQLEYPIVCSSGETTLYYEFTLYNPQTTKSVSRNPDGSFLRLDYNDGGYSQVSCDSPQDTCDFEYSSPNSVSVEQRQLMLCGSSSTDTVTTTRYLVQFDATLSPAQVRGKVNSLIQKITKRPPDFVFTHTLKGMAMALTESERAALASTEGVTSLDEDLVVELNGELADQLHNTRFLARGGGNGGSGTQQQVPWGVQRVKYASGADYSSSANRVWILDTGIQMDHPDLFVDVAKSISVFSGKDAKPADGLGHGTHLAGIVGACDNTIGVVGVAPCAPLVAVKVIQSTGSGTVSSIVAGIDHVAANAADGDVVNMSFGNIVIQQLDDALKIAAQKRPSVFWVSSAGNNKVDAINQSPARLSGLYPSWNNLITVAGMGAGDVWSSYSNFGQATVDFIAPGDAIYSTAMGSGYTTMGGTSQAAPHVAGIIFLQTNTGGFNPSLWPTDGAVTRTGATDSYPILVAQ